MNLLGSTRIRSGHRRGREGEKPYSEQEKEAHNRVLYIVYETVSTLCHFRLPKHDRKRKVSPTMRPNPLLVEGLKKAHLPVPTELFVVDTESGVIRFNASGRVFYGPLIGWPPVSIESRMTVPELFTRLAEKLCWIEAAVVMHLFGLDERGTPSGRSDIAFDVRAIHELATFLDQHGQGNAYVILKRFAIDCSRVHRMPGDPFASLRNYQRGEEERFFSDGP
jgi:hypothetical protein